MTTLRIAIVAGAPLVQAGLSRVVGSASDLELVAVAFSLRGLQASLATQPDLQVDVAIVDRSADDDVAALGGALAGGMRVVLLTDAEPAQLAPLIAAGAACLPTNADEREITAAVQAVASGLVAMRSELFDELLQRSGGANERRPAELVEPLTPRELQVLRLLAGGFANKHIAHDLGISEHTAKFHVGRILGKLDAATRAEAVAIGLRDGLIESEREPTSRTSDLSPRTSGSSSRTSAFPSRASALPSRTSASSPGTPALASRTRPSSSRTK